MNNYKDISSFNKYDKEFFNINKNEEFLLKLKKSFIKSIKGLFIYANKEKDLVIFYGNNRDVLGYDDEFIIMTFDEEYVSSYDDFKIAVNLSEIQLREGDFVEYLNLLIDEFDVSPRYIEIEITESMIMKSVDRNIGYLLELKKLGASIALDDFVTGYSSFNHLIKLPIDVLKLDRSFIVDMIDNHKSRYVIENMITTKKSYRWI